MNFIHIFVLSFIQGLTEFLPISSSAHLVIYTEIISELEENLSLDIALHIGSLIAVICLLMKPLKVELIPTIKEKGRKKSFYLIFIATLPVILLALCLEFFDLINKLRQIEVIAFTNIIFAIILFFSDRMNESRKLDSISTKDALIIGIWQAFAVFPGASRSGSTITAARFLKFNRQDSVIISIVLSIPIIALSSSYILLKILNSYNSLEVSYIFFGTFLSFIFSFLSLKLFIHVAGTLSLTPFVIYRLFLSLCLLVLIFN